MVRVVDCHAGVLGSNPGGPRYFPLGITSKVFILHKVIIEIAQEVETSFPEVGKRYLLGRRLFLTVRIYILSELYIHVGRANIPQKRAVKSVGD